MMLKLKDQEIENMSMGKYDEQGRSSISSQLKAENLSVENQILKNRAEDHEKKINDYKNKLLEMNEQFSK